MIRTTVLTALLAIGISLVSSGSDIEAAEIKVLSAAVMKPVFTELAGEFERITGHTLAISYEPAGAARSRIVAGANVDVAILQRPVAEELARRGKINSHGMATLARSGLAVAVRQGMSKPDISTIEAFNHTLLAAR